MSLVSYALARGKSDDSTPFNIRDRAAELGIGDIPVVGDDRLTYVTPATKVHSGVFMDEN